MVRIFPYTAGNDDCQIQTDVKDKVITYLPGFIRGHMGLRVIIMDANTHALLDTMSVHGLCTIYSPWFMHNIRKDCCFHGLCTLIQSTIYAHWNTIALIRFKSSCIYNLFHRSRPWFMHIEIPSPSSASSLHAATTRSIDHDSPPVRQRDAINKKNEEG